MEYSPQPATALVLSSIVGLTGLASYLIGPNLVKQFLLAAVLGLLITNDRYLWVDIILRTLRRDVTAAMRFVELKYKLWLVEKRRLTVAKVFRKLCVKHPDKVAILYEDESWTFSQLDEFSNRVGNHFKSLNFVQGDTVALFMENRLEYTALWLGLSKIGVVTALINSNLRDKPLLHSIMAGKSKAVIYSSDLAKAISDIRDGIKSCQLLEYSSKPQTQPPVVDLKTVLSTTSASSLDRHMDCLDHSHKLLYIYTSGTTGLPKAAVITNMRYLFTVIGSHVMTGIRDDDILYNPLPLYHTSGGTVAMGQCLVAGNTVALRKKFSRSNYWLDCIKYNATVVCYIGEICRYLLTAPESAADTRHRVRLMIGNGLRPQIWTTFTQRFNIPSVGEFYGATEGNSNLVNIDSHVGSVGFIPRIAKAIYPVTLIQVNEETEEPIRNRQGLCIECKPGEPGMFVGKIKPSQAINSFAGYVDHDATKKKILRDVFTKGDHYFNSGDILVMDRYGYFYFKDRTGDTFRWRGENVAASEVEAVLFNILNLRDTAVYGVEVPHIEGKAGMAAIHDPEGSLNLQILDEGLQKMLPAYARPLFIRIVEEVPMTGTYKLKKKDLQMEGYNPLLVKDKLFFHDGRTNKFVLLTSKIYQDLLNGDAKL